MSVVWVSASVATVILLSLVFHAVRRRNGTRLDGHVLAAAIGRTRKEWLNLGSE